MTDERNSALLHLLALVQGRRADARRRWERATYPNWRLEEAIDAANARLEYLADYLRSRTPSRHLP